MKEVLQQYADTSRLRMWTTVWLGQILWRNRALEEGMSGKQDQQPARNERLGFSEDAPFSRSEEPLEVLSPSPDDATERATSASGLDDTDGQELQTSRERGGEIEIGRSFEPAAFRDTFEAPRGRDNLRNHGARTTLHIGPSEDRSESDDPSGKAAAFVDAHAQSESEADQNDGHKDELHQLATQQEWMALVGRCEQLLREDQDTALAQAWWIVAQSKLSQIPAELLAAPLERVLQSDELGSAGEGIEREVRLTTEALCAALEARGRREIALHLLQLLSAREDAPASEVARGMASRAVEEMKAIPSYKRDDMHEQKLEALAHMLAHGAVGPAMTSTEKEDSVHGRRHPKVRLILLSLGFLAALGVLYSQKFFHQDPLVIAPLALQHIPQSSRLSVPIPERLSGLQLDAVLQDLNALPSQSKPVTEPPKTLPASAAAPSAPTKEVINTSTPVEPPNFPRFESPATKPQRESERTIDQGFVKDFPGKKPGAGSFGTEARYRVLAPTRVISSPSIRAELITELRAGDMVVVEGQEGSWLRLRSKNGDLGYILRQDAVPDAP